MFLCDGRSVINHRELCEPNRGHFKVLNQNHIVCAEVHEALNAMAALRQELSTFSFSLDVLPCLCDAGKAPYPEELKRKLVDLMSVCASIINGMEDLLDKMPSGSLARRVQWAAYGQKDMEKLRSNLKGYVLAVDCVMHTVNQYEASQNSLSLYSFDSDRSVLIESIKQDTEQIKRDTSAIRDDTKLAPGIKEDTFQIKDVLDRIQAQLPQSQPRICTHADIFIILYKLCAVATP
jgi:hypothetical protein